MAIQNLIQFFASNRFLPGPPSSSFKLKEPTTKTQPPVTKQNQQSRTSRDSNFVGISKHAFVCTRSSNTSVKKTTTRSSRRPTANWLVESFFSVNAERSTAAAGARSFALDSCSFCVLSSSSSCSRSRRIGLIETREEDDKVVRSRDWFRFCPCDGDFGGGPSIGDGCLFSLRTMVRQIKR